MKDWQAALVAYIVALLLAETEAAPLAVVMSWALAVEQVLETASSGAKPLQDLFNAGATSGPALPPVGSITPNIPQAQIINPATGQPIPGQR